MHNASDFGFFPSGQTAACRACGKAALDCCDGIIRNRVVFYVEQISFASRGHMRDSYSAIRPDGKGILAGYKTLWDALAAGEAKGWLCVSRNDPTAKALAR